jgi:hypothetical protein
MRFTFSGFSEEGTFSASLFAALDGEKGSHRPGLGGGIGRKGRKGGVAAKISGRVIRGRRGPSGPGGPCTMPAPLTSIKIAGLPISIMGAGVGIRETWTTVGPISQEIVGLAIVKEKAAIPKR